MIILTLNCGSSSVKYQLYDWTCRQILARGVVERVTVGGSSIRHSVMGRDEVIKEHECRNHEVAIELILDTISHPEYGALKNIRDINAVGHRVVHGGDKFSKSIEIDDTVLKAFKEFSHLAPLHLPANILGIEGAKRVLPDVPQCAIMDTAWHQTMPDYAFMYALPYAWYEDHNVRRYGFHGTSFLYCAKRAAVLLGKDPFETNLIICHIGNGSSVCAVRNGVSADTSMGLTPLEGLVMGTRSGDCDPAIGFYVMKQIGISAGEAEEIMNRGSGLLGITGSLIDRRDIVKAAGSGDDRASLALEMEAYRIKKYIGAYTAALGRVDAVVFTAGVGEMAPLIRQKALAKLDNLGIALDQRKNEISASRNVETELTGRNSLVRVLVIPTDEELVMTEDTFALTRGTYDIHTNFLYSFQEKDYHNSEREEAYQEELAGNPKLAEIRALQ
ncbi:MAG: propionate kinase [Spirochaetales bacterium]|nr:propionate kinase [Spirochaetales bacterium]